MTLDEEECWRRLHRARHGVLSTVHPRRGVDAVPAVFVVADRRIVIPVDTVKAKRHLRLRRMANTATDPRCVLLVDRYHADWSELWWVRVHATARATDDPSPWAAALAERYPPYRAPGSLAGALVLEPTEVSGWRAG